MPRSGGRRGQRRERSERQGFHQLPWRNLVNPYAPIEVLSADQVEAIHRASLRILAELGIAFLSPEALDILAAAGADVDHKSQVVRFDAQLIEEQIAKAPARFVMHARNPAHNITFGGNNINFSTVASAPNASDMQGGRRPGCYRDYCDFLRLGQALNVVHLFGGYPVEPVDLPPPTRHLDCTDAFIRLGDKVFFAYSLGRERIIDGIEMTRIARGVSSEQMLREPALLTVVNSSSPLRIDGPMLEGVIEMARHNQVMALTPFTLAGAMAPATLAGALAQQNAEALAGLAFSQIVNPGTPVIYGGFTSNVDMKSGAPAFGTPEYTKAALAGGQLARRYNIPYRSSNANACNVVDAQAAYESEMSLWGAIMGHAGLVLHAAGWMEGGLCASFEKFVVDAELLQMMAEFLTPMEVNEETLGFEAMREVGHGGHFFGSQHTLDRYETAFYAPILSDWRNYEAWEEAGAHTVTERANKLYREILTDFEPPPLEKARSDELVEFIARRKEEGGVRAT
ncbi:MAG: methyltransferase [Gammaproteobacteria bacterium]|jgi:trimethylamine--corrinoid protein Co-methyltransferase|nr:methyltransferase [Gammaproteobacteria bacterium]